MDYKEVRIEQLGSLILQYQDLLFIEEQKYLTARPKSRTQRDSEEEIKRLKTIIQQYKNELNTLGGALNTKQILQHEFSGGQIQSNYIFEDDFYSNQNNWWLGENERIITQMENGCFTMLSKVEDGRIIWYDGGDIQMNPYQSITMEYVICLLQNVDNYGYGFIWGKNRDEFYDFCLSGNGYFTLGITREGKWNEIHKWQYNTCVAKDPAFNKVKIEAQGEMAKFTINGVEVLEKQLPDLPENYTAMGFVVYKNMKIAVDYLKIYYAS